METDSAAKIAEKWIRIVTYIILCDNLRENSDHSQKLTSMSYYVEGQFSDADEDS